MAKLSATVAVAATVTVLLITLPLSAARIRPPLPENDVIRNDLKVNPIIRLPSETDSTESHSEPIEKVPEKETVTVESVPVRIARFRPVNRHYRFISRLPLRPCHHHHHHHHHGFFKRMEIVPYGRDMKLPSGENSDFDPSMIDGEVRRIPVTWVSVGHHHDHDDDDDEISKFAFKHWARFGNEKFKRHFHHHDDDDDEEKEENRFEEGVKKKHKKEKKEDGLIKRIRKMLNF